MSYSGITCSTKTLTLAIALILFISIGVLYGFAMLSEEVYSSSWGDRCTYLAVNSSEKLNPLSASILLCISI